MLPQRVTPLTWTLFWEPCGAAGWRGALLDRIGFDESDLPDARSVVALVDGWAYLNASILREWSSRLPAGNTDLADRMIAKSGMDLPQHQRAGSPPDAISNGILSQWYSWVTESASQHELKVDAELSQTCVAGRPDFHQCTDLDLVNRATSLQELARRLFEQHVNQTLASNVGPALVAEACASVSQPGHLLALLSGLGSVEPVALPRAIWELSRMVRSSPGLRRLFEQDEGDLIEVLRLSTQPEALGLVAAIEALASEVAFRGSNGWELASRTIGEEVESILDTLACLRHVPDSADPVSKRREVEDNRGRLVAEMASSLHGAERSQFLAGVKSAGVFLRGRELSRTNVLRVLHEMRLPIAELGRRARRRNELEAVNHVWMLNAEEVEYYGDGGMGDVAKLASERYDAFTNAETSPAEMAVASNSGISFEPDVRPSERFALEQLEPGDMMLGIPGSPGMASGPARVVTSALDLDTVRPGEVLVVDRPELVYAPIFPATVAVLAERGHLKSHAVVVAREFGLPVVTGLAGLTQRVTNGTILNVDGLAGVVSVTSSAADQVLANTGSSTER